MHIDDVIGHFYGVVCAVYYLKILAYITKRKLQGALRLNFIFEFYFHVLKKKFHSLAALVHKILFFVTGK